jgi:hypothetical protein
LTLPTAKETEAAATKARNSHRPGSPTPPIAHLFSARAASSGKSVTASWMGSAAAFLGELRDLIESPELALLDP